MPTRKANPLQARAFGPNQPPLTEAEYAELQRLHHTTRGKEAPAATPPVARRESPNRLLIAVTVVAVATVAGSVGYILGNAGQNTHPEPTNLSDGIQLADGQFRQFADATCLPILSFEDATLTGVNCSWADGASVSLGLDGAISSG